MHSPSRILSCAIAGAAALFLVACGPKKSGDAPAKRAAVKLPTNGEVGDVKFEPSEGRSWSHLIVNPTTSGDYLGFRVRYILTEPEYEKVTTAQVWRETDIKSWADPEFFFKIHSTFVRQVRPVGSGGWYTGYFAAKYYDQAQPETLFQSMAVPLIDEDAGSPPSTGGFVKDFPDAGARTGKFQSQLRNVAKPVTDISAPDFNAQAKALVDKELLFVEERTLPRAAPGATIEQRRELKIASDAFLKKAGEALKGKHVWSGAIAFPNQTISVQLTVDGAFREERMIESRLSGRLERLDRKGVGFDVNGGIYDNPGAPNSMTCFQLNSQNRTAAYVAETKQAMTTHPLEEDRALANCEVQVLDATHIQISAEGVPATTLTRTK